MAFFDSPYPTPEETTYKKIKDSKSLIKMANSQKESRSSSNPIMAFSLNFGGCKDIQNPWQNRNPKA